MFIIFGVFELLGSGDLCFSSNLGIWGYYVFKCLLLSLLFFWDSLHIDIGMFNIGPKVSETHFIFLKCFFSIFFRLVNFY